MRPNSMVITPQLPSKGTSLTTTGINVSVNISFEKIPITDTGNSALNSVNFG